MDAWPVSRIHTAEPAKPSLDLDLVGYCAQRPLCTVLHDAQ